LDGCDKDGDDGFSAFVAAGMKQDEDGTGVSKHSLVIAGHRTSVSLERAFWDALGEIAEAEGVSRAALVATLDAQRGKANLSSALRVFVLKRAMGKIAADDDGPSVG
jgi:predicted DNA-binding ribbon-helix-helix protein